MINKAVKTILFIGIGFLIFIAPIKFGMPIDPKIQGLHKNIYLWLVNAWPLGIWPIIVLMLLAIWLFSSILSGKIKLRYSSIDIPILIFLASATVSTFNAANMHRAHLYLTQYFSYAIIYFIVLNILDKEKDLRYFLRILVISCIIISIYGIYQYYIELPETRIFAQKYLNKELLELIQERLASNRIFSTFVYPNTLAGYLLLCIPLVLAIYATVRRKKNGIKIKLFYIFSLIIIFYAFILTFSKTSFAILVIILIFLAVLKIKGRYRYLSLIILMIILLLGIVMLGYIGFSSEFLNKTGGSLMNRLEYWSAGIKIIKEHPVIGIGPYNFGAIYPKYKLDVAEEVQNAHNNYLQIFAEQGIVGFLAFCAIWIILLIRRNRINNGRLDEKWILMGLYIGLIAFVMHNFMDVDWYIPGLTIIAWVFIGITIWIRNDYREKVFVIESAKKGIIFFIVLLLFVFALAKEVKILLAENYFNAAQEVFKEKNISLTEKYAKALLKMDGDNSNAYFLLSKISLINKDYLQSIFWGEKALKYNPYNSAVYYNMSLAYIYQMQVSDSLQHVSLNKCDKDALEKAVEYYPTNPFYRLKLAQFYELNKQQELAIREYKLCLEIAKKIENSYQASGGRKILKQLMLPPDVIEGIEKKISIGT